MFCLKNWIYSSDEIRLTDVLVTIAVVHNASQLVHTCTENSNRMSVVVVLQMCRVVDVRGNNGLD